MTTKDSLACQLSILSSLSLLLSVPPRVWVNPSRGAAQAQQRALVALVERSRELATGAGARRFCAVLNAHLGGCTPRGSLTEDRAYTLGIVQ